jgi:DNA-binding NtrC family response regulator
MLTSAQTPSYLGMPAVISSRALRDLFANVERMAKTNAAVLISGESGSGKELVARAVHHYSPRSNRPWVDLNCAAIPDQLVESELFGHERGAFQGADYPKPGLFELADGGTLFLDEVGELDPRLQVKLLRVLDGASFYRLGGIQKVNIDVRIVAATNQDLKDLVRAGKFREDLYHRMAQIEVKVPALRERLEDIVPIAELYLRQQNRELVFTSDAKKALEAYHWPGNVRELRNVIVQCAVMAGDGEIHALDLPERIQDCYAALPVMESDLKRLYVAMNEDRTADDDSAPPLAQGAILQGMEKHLILKVLAHTQGHQERAAQLLGISRRTLSRKLKIYSEEEPGLAQAVSGLES